MRIRRLEFICQKLCVKFLFKIIYVHGTKCRFLYDVANRFIGRHRSHGSLDRVGYPGYRIRLSIYRDRLSDGSLYILAIQLDAFVLTAKDDLFDRNRCVFVGLIGFFFL